MGRLDGRRDWCCGRWVHGLARGSLARSHDESQEGEAGDSDDDVHGDSLPHVERDGPRNARVPGYAEAPGVTGGLVGCSGRCPERCGDRVYGAGAGTTNTVARSFFAFLTSIDTPIATPSSAGLPEPVMELPAPRSIPYRSVSGLPAESTRRVE